MTYNIMALFAYIFGWLSGLIVYFISKEDPVARFHGIQSVLANIVYTILFAIVAVVIIGIAFVITLVLNNAGLAGIIFGLAGLVVALMGIALGLLMLWTMWNALNNKIYKLPLIGGLAEKWA